MAPSRCRGRDTVKTRLSITVVTSSSYRPTVHDKGPTFVQDTASLPNMGWPYRFLNLDEAERHARRHTLDRYASYAQLSSLIPVALVLLYRIGRWAAKSAASRKGSYNAIPNSPALKFERQSERGAWQTQINKLRWWLAGDFHLFGQLYGQRDQWVFGGLWTIWLLFLCIAETGQGE